MGKLFELIDAYRDRYAPHQPSYSKIAEQVGVSRQTLLNWRTPKIMLRSKRDSDAKVLGMNSHPWGEPESAVSELLETIPDLWACVDRALARAFAGMASADLAGARRRSSWTRST